MPFFTFFSSTLFKICTESVFNLDSSMILASAMVAFSLLIRISSIPCASFAASYSAFSESEANLKEGKISVNTPIAQGLLGKKVGDVAEITVPQGKIALEVVNISI